MTSYSSEEHNLCNFILYTIIVLSRIQNITCLQMGLYYTSKCHFYVFVMEMSGIA